ncbi:DNA pilot protein [Flyfo microvirus Tbat2_151]|nr:DNA pilot protein [Flyfo microvirus Tbat2_151]
MFPAIIGALGSVAGGLMGMASANKANATNAAINDRNIKLQKQFAQQGVRWKVEDAKKAGVHPLYALGAQTHSFTPSSIGAIADNSLGAGIANAGQDIAAGIDRTRTASERNTAVAQTMNDLTLTRMGLENELLAAQIAKTRGAGSPPPMPSGGDDYLIGGQTQSGLVESLPMERTNPNPAAPWAEPGAITDTGWSRTSTGGWAPVYSQDVKQRLEEDPIGMLTWNVRNRLFPSVGYTHAQPPFSPGEGRSWHYDVAHQEWRSVPQYSGRSTANGQTYYHGF